MKKIPCGYKDGEVLYTLVDDSLYDKLKVSAWHIGYHSYSRRKGIRKVQAVSTTIRRDDGKQTQLLMHHVVLGKPTNGMVVNHINGNPLDNRRANLEFTTTRENIIKGRGFKGGWISNQSNRFKITISFATREEAEEALRKHYEDHPD